MKKTCYLLCVLLSSFTVTAQEQEQIKPIKTQSNGVVVYESAGNEGFFVNSANPVVVRSIEEWTLPECIDALHAIDEKLIYLGESEEDVARKKAYLAQRAIVEAKKQSFYTTK